MSLKEFEKQIHGETALDPVLALRDKLIIVEAMQTRQGRKLVRRIFEQTGFMRSTFHPDTNTSFFNQGQANTGIWLYTLIDEHCPDLFLTLMKEAKEEQEYDRRSNAGGDDNDGNRDSGGSGNN